MVESGDARASGRAHAREGQAATASSEDTVGAGNGKRRRDANRNQDVVREWWDERP